MGSEKEPTLEEAVPRWFRPWLYLLGIGIQLGTVYLLSRLLLPLFLDRK